MVEWSEKLHYSLPQGQVGEVAAAIAGGLAVATVLDVDTAAVGRYASMTARGLTSAGLRASKICEVIVPAFGGLSSKDVVAVRESSTVFADVRAALDRVADNIPDDRERAARLGPSIARDILAPAIESLQKEARRSPTLSAATTASWTLAATGIDVAVSSISIGTAMTAAAASIGLFADWAVRLRTKKSERAAVRVLRTFQ